MSLKEELESLEIFMTETAETVDNPIFVHMLGIPGCGKTSFLKILQSVWSSKNKPSVTLLGFDQVMQSIPSYQAIGDKIAAFAEMELPARETGYRILEGLLQKRAHIIFDNGGSAESHPDLLRQARDNHGYQLVFVSIVTPVILARARVYNRSIKEGQHTPPHYLEERQLKLEKLIPIYQSLTPHFYNFDNNSTEFDAFEKTSYQIATAICRDIVA
jgi:predicted ABC-type ATPase